MKTDDRRKRIADELSAAREPISGGELSKKFGVSRQIIVQDISVLKSEGYEIYSTHQGYVMGGASFSQRIFKTRHTSEETEDELNLIVDLGGEVVDVFVWHKVYGKISAPLNISSRLGVRRFIEGVRSGKSTELMNITGGYHYHTVRAKSEEVLDVIEKALEDKNFTAPEI